MEESSACVLILGGGGGGGGAYNRMYFFSFQVHGPIIGGKASNRNFTAF